jgi:Apea-like HEPN
VAEAVDAVTSRGSTVLPPLEGRHVNEQNGSDAAPDLTGTIAAWLEHERQRASAAARNKGVPMSVMIPEWYGERNEHGGSSGQQRERRVSPVAVSGRPLLDALLVLEFDADGRECAARLHEAYGTGCFFFSPFAPGSFEVDPKLWLQGALMAPLRHQYLASIVTLDAADPNEATAIATDAVRLLASDEATLVTMLPIGGIVPVDGDIRLDDVRIRQLTSEEIGEQLAAMAGGHARSRRVALWGWQDLRPCTTAVLEVREQGSKTRQVMGEHLTHRIVLALQLLGYEVFGGRDATAWREPGPSVATSGVFLPLAEGGAEQPCSAEKLKEARALAEKIPADVFTGGVRHGSIALHRFHLGATEKSPADAILDFTMALESVLLQGERAELALRFRLCGAYFLAPHDAAIRREVSLQLQELYKVRSKIVHGGQRGSLESLESVCAQARALTAQTLVKGLQEGWPTRGDLLDPVITGAGE